MKSSGFNVNTRGMKWALIETIRVAWRNIVKVQFRNHKYTEERGELIV